MLLKKGSQGPEVVKLQRMLNIKGYPVGVPDGIFGNGTQAALIDYQSANGLTVDGIAGPQTIAGLELDQCVENPNTIIETMELTDSAKRFMIKVMSVFEGNFWSVNKDYEFEGWFDRPKRLNGQKLIPAVRAQQPGHKPNGFSKYGRSPGHVGLSWGFIQFTQDSGTLGQVLQRAYELDPSKFCTHFGGVTQAQALLKVLSAKGKRARTKDNDSPTGYARRSPRVQPVNGLDIWKGEWARLFQAAGHKALFQQAQLEIAIELYFDSMLKRSARPYGIRSQKGLTILVDRTVQLGGGGCRKLLDTYCKSMKGQPEPELFTHLYRKVHNRSWAHRTRKLMDSDEVSWYRLFDTE